MLRFSSLYPGVQFRARLTCNFFIWKVEVTVISLKVTEKLNTARLCHMELLFLWIKRGEHWQLRVIQQMLIKCQPVSSTMCPQRNVAGDRKHKGHKDKDLDKTEGSWPSDSYQRLVKAALTSFQSSALLHTHLPLTPLTSLNFLSQWNFSSQSPVGPTSC